MSSTVNFSSIAFTVSPAQTDHDREGADARDGLADVERRLRFGGLGERRPDGRADNR